LYSALLADLAFSWALPYGNGKTPRKKIKVKRQKPYNNHGHMAAGSEKGLIRIR
jgi:hypothetical protein